MMTKRNATGRRSALALIMAFAATLGRPAPAQEPEDARNLKDKLQTTIDLLSDLRKTLDIPKVEPIAVPDSVAEFMLAGSFSWDLRPENLDAAYRTAIGESARINFRYVPGGTFVMGASDDERKRAKNSDDPSFSIEWSVPEHPVRVANGFFIAETEVTRGQYLAYLLNRNPKLKFKDYPTALKPITRVEGDRIYLDETALAEPIVNLNWNDARAFCEWLSTIQPTLLRGSLPTEIEWEYAARGPRGDIATMPDSDPYYFSEMHLKVHKVGTDPKDRSWCGVYDMGGNVEEWCLDDFDQDLLKRQAAQTAGGKKPFSYLRPETPASKEPGSQKIVRGGSFQQAYYQCRTYNRRWKSTDSTEYKKIGFRPVMLVAPPAANPPPKPSTPAPRETSTNNSSRRTKK